MELIVFTLSLSLSLCVYEYIYIYELDMQRHQRIYFSIADVRVGIRTDSVCVMASNV